LAGVSRLGGREIQPNITTFRYNYSFSQANITMGVGVDSWIAKTKIVIILVDGKSKKDFTYRLCF
jgi:hypothetical protein